jgi:hypothetical protein
LGTGDIAWGLIIGTGLSAVILSVPADTLGLLVRVVVGSVVGGFFGVSCLSMFLLRSLYDYDHGFGERADSMVIGGFIGIFVGGVSAYAIFKIKQVATAQDQWRFADPKNVAVITLKSITMGGGPILRVTHDAEDGMWQFLDGSTVSQENASVVSLEEITRSDPSVMQLADLPLGWYADRSAADEPWRRGRKRT